MAMLVKLVEEECRGPDVVRFVRVTITANMYVLTMTTTSVPGWRLILHGLECYLFQENL